MTPLTTAESISNNEILDYTGSPHHCVNIGTTEIVAKKCLTSWQDDYQRCQKELYGRNSPDPWRTRRRSQNVTSSTRPVDTTGCPKIKLTDADTVIDNGDASTVSHSNPSSASSSNTGKCKCVL